MECSENISNFCWQDYSLKELESLKDARKLVEQYNLSIESLKCENRFNKEIVLKQYGLPISKIEENCFYNLEKHCDDDGNIMAFYPVIREVRSRMNRICHFSGAIIRKGSIYIYYRPLLENVITHSTYVLQKPICTEVAYRQDLPKNYMEFCYMDKQLQNGLDYYDFSVNYGNDSLKLQKFKSKHKKSYR